METPAPWSPPAAWVPPTGDGGRGLLRGALVLSAISAGANLVYGLSYVLPVPFFYAFGFLAFVLVGANAGVAAAVMGSIGLAKTRARPTAWITAWLATLAGTGVGLFVLGGWSLGENDNEITQTGQIMRGVAICVVTVAAFACVRKILNPVEVGVSARG